MGSVFCFFWHTFLGLLPGTCFLSFWLFFGVTSHFRVKSFLRVILDASTNYVKKRMAAVPRNFGKGGWCLRIISCLGLSWVMVPLGPGHQKGAGEVRPGTGHCLCSKRGGGFPKRDSFTQFLYFSEEFMHLHNSMLFPFQYFTSFDYHIHFPRRYFFVQSSTTAIAHPRSRSHPHQCCPLM